MLGAEQNAPWGPIAGESSSAGLVAPPSLEWHFKDFHRCSSVKLSAAGVKFQLAP